MPWRHTSPLDQKTPVSADSRRDRLSVPELCARAGVRRKTGDTWSARALMPGPQGLEARSRRPSTSPRHTPGPGVAASLDARGRHPSGGAKKRLAIVGQRHPRWPWPARSTVCDILRRHGLGPKKRQRRGIGPPGTPTRAMEAPHAVGSADVNGPFKTGDRRFLLSGHALSAPSVAQATPGCRRVVNACGRPRRLRPDHGVPCATNPLARRSPLSAWGVRLGLVPAGRAPAKPPQHGRHERLPRPRKADTTRPPGATRRAQPRSVQPGAAAGGARPAPPRRRR
jgi:putative transposase